MTVRIEIFGESAKEALLELGGLSALLGSTALSSGSVGEAGSAGTSTSRRGKPRSTGTTESGASGSTGQAISSGEERADPETDKHDAKDEAADTAAQQPKPLTLNHDSVRKLMGGYVMAYGMEAAQADGKAIIGCEKISEIKDEQKPLATAVIAIATAIQKNPHNRDMAGDGLTKEKTEELKPFVQAAQQILAA